jgi:hypothetical protein
MMLWRIMRAFLGRVRRSKGGREVMDMDFSKSKKGLGDLYQDDMHKKLLAMELDGAPTNVHFGFPQDVSTCFAGWVEDVTALEYGGDCDVVGINRVISGRQWRFDLC